MARGFRVEFINLSGTEVLDWCDNELFRRVNDRQAGEFVVIVVSYPYSTFRRKCRGGTGSDVYGLNGLWPDDKEVVKTETLCVCVPMHRDCGDHPQQVQTGGLGAAKNSYFCFSIVVMCS